MKIGFIGCGNMAGAIIRGILAAGAAAPEDIIGADLSAAARDKVREGCGIRVTDDQTEVVRSAETVFLTVNEILVLGQIAVHKRSIHNSILLIAGQR